MFIIFASKINELLSNLLNIPSPKGNTFNIFGQRKAHGFPIEEDSSLMEDGEWGIKDYILVVFFVKRNTF